MKKFVPYEKMSKKQKREYDRQRRGTWALSPVTRVAETDKTHYSRKVKHKNSGGDDSLPLFDYPTFYIAASAAMSLDEGFTLPSMISASGALTFRF